MMDYDPVGFRGIRVLCCGDGNRRAGRRESEEFVRRFVPQRNRVALKLFLIIEQSNSKGRRQRA